jgi:hypothetical protein
MLTYTGPVYAEIGIEQYEKDDVANEIQRYAQAEVEVGELPSGKIKVFTDQTHNTTIEIDKQDCSIMRKKDDSLALGFKFGGLMWGFGPEIKIGHSSGVAWKSDVQRMVAEYQELCTQFNTGRLSQQEYQAEKQQIVQRGYNYARELEKRFKQKKDAMFREMDQGKYIHLQNTRFYEGCCIFLPQKVERNMLVSSSPFRKMIPTDCRDMGVCNRSRNFDSVLPDKYYGTTFEQRTIMDAMEHAQRMNRARRFNRGNSNGSWNIRIRGGW